MTALMRRHQSSDKEVCCIQVDVAERRFDRAAGFVIRVRPGCTTCKPMYTSRSGFCRIKSSETGNFKCPVLHADLKGATTGDDIQVSNTITGNTG
jgi:hypothetical protein